MKLSREPSTTQSGRIYALEQRADSHDKIIKPMAEQVSEMYGLLTKWRNINWFVVKLAAAGGGILGFLAVVLTIAEKVAHFTGH